MKLIPTIVSALALPALALAICNDGEVGVGLSQSCTVYGGQNTACSRADATVFANDCGTIAYQGFDGAGGNFCQTGTYIGGDVQCDGNGAVTHVSTPGGDFGNCYKYSGSQTCGGFQYYRQIYYCCSRV